MLLKKLASSYLAANRGRALAAAWILVAAIAFLDWRVARNVSLGVLYLFPLLLAAGHMSRPQIVLMAAGCTMLREAFSPFALDLDAIPRMGMVLLALSGTGLFFGELARSRRMAEEHVREIRAQAAQRQAAEEQLQLLIESSPAAIVTADAAGNIVLANSAAHDLFGFDRGALCGEPLARYLPLPAIPSGKAPGAQFSHRMAECAGQRRDGSAFFAQVWVSSYATPTGRRTAAIIYDASGQLRDREEAGLHRLLLSAHTLLGALWHEVRNVCGAIGALHARLKRTTPLRGNEDFEVLETLIEGLGKIASRELQPAPEPVLQAVDVAAVLNQARIITGPSFRELGAEARWDIAAPLPAVKADPHALLQVFLNLIQNARRALRESERKEFDVRARGQNGGVAVRFRNSGPGIAQPDRLFRPFQPGADATGLGLYISRAIVRSFGGELRYEPQEEGCGFVVELSVAGVREAGA